MTAIDDLFSNHPVHGALKAARTAFQGTTKVSELDAELVDYLAQIDFLLATVARLLSGLDPQLVPIGILDELKPQIDAISTRLSAFVANPRDSQQIIGVQPNLEVVSRGIASLAGLSVASAAVEGLQESVTTYRKSAGQHIANLRKDSTALQAEVTASLQALSELKSAIDGQKARVDSVIAEQQKQFGDDQQGRNTEWTEMVKEFNEARSESLSELQEFGSESLSDSNEATTAAVKKIAKEGSEALEALTARGGSTLEELETFRNQARDLIEATAVDATTADYKTAARTDTRRANGWLYFSVVVMVVGVVFVLVTVFASTGQTDLLVTVLRAAVVGAAFAGPALLAQRESQKHRAAARASERFALELAALEPFLANLEEPAVREAIRREFADRVFGHDTGADELVSADQLTQSGLMELLKLLIKKF